MLFLRPGEPGGVIKGGDIDNRLLTLSDALSLPTPGQLTGIPINHNTNDPFFCLLEDDSLISSWSVRTEQLLSLPADMHDSYVRLIIDVFIKVTRITEGNISLMGD